MNCTVVPVTSNPLSLHCRFVRCVDVVLDLQLLSDAMAAAWDLALKPPPLGALPGTAEALLRR